MAGSGTNQTIGQQVSQQTLPAWENAGYQNVASQAFGQAFDSNTGLPNGSPANQSVADQSPNFQNYLGNAMNAPTAGSGLKNNLEGYNPNVTVNPTSTGTWNQQAADQYMSPYTNSVLKSQEALAHDTYGQQKSALDQQAAASGALGGDRNAVAQSGLDHDFALQEQNLQANALNSAYQNGQTAFNNDQNRQLQSDVTNSQLGLAAGIQNAELNFGAKAASNQFGLGQGQLNLAGLGQAGQAAQLGQNYEQSKNDTSYQNAMMNYLFPEQQVSYAQGILNGTPQQWTNQTDLFLPGGNPYSQALGAQAKGSSKGGGSGSAGPSKGGSGSTPAPGAKPGQTPISSGSLGYPSPTFDWNQIGGVGGFQTPPFTPPSANATDNVGEPPNINASDGSGLYGEAQSIYDPTPSDGSPTDIINQMYGSPMPYEWAGMNGGNYDTSTDPLYYGSAGSGQFDSGYKNWDWSGLNAGGQVGEMAALQQAQQNYSGFGSQLTPEEWDAYGGNLRNPLKLA